MELVLRMLKYLTMYLRPTFDDGNITLGSQICKVSRARIQIMSKFLSLFFLLSIFFVVYF